MGVETTYGLVNGERQKVESTVGVRGWVHMESSVKANERFSFHHKMTGHIDGNIHHHLRLPDDTVNDFLDKRAQGTMPEGRILSSVIKRGL